MEFETRAIHAGQEPDPATGAITTPIYQTSTYVQDAVGEHKGFDYSRAGNPTRTALETCLASLEGAEHGPKSPQAQSRLRRILLVARIDVALMFLIVFDMVAKPFNWG